MKIQSALPLGLLFLGVACTAGADGGNRGTPPPPPQFMLTTALAHGGAAQTGGVCNIFNAGNQALTITDIHAEDGNGNTLAATSADSCTSAPLASKHSCSTTFSLGATDNAVCLAVVSAAASTPPPSSGHGKDNKPSNSNTAPPPAKMALEVSDAAGNTLARSEGTAYPLPPSTSGGGGNGGHD